MQIGPGTRLGPYELGAMLGAGGMGAVYRARDTRLSRNVAIKVLPAGLHADAEQRERLAREARAISALSHPNICALYDVGSADGIDYLVMELLDGETLSQRLTKGPLPVDQGVALAIDIALALDAAHRAGFVHRDLKPGNIMLTRNGARLLDFGLAKALSPASFDTHAPTAPAPLTREGMVVGTLRYMAPEQLEGRELDARTDIYAFGLVLFEMLAGELPGRPLSAINPHVSAELERIVKRCLEKGPDDRWQSARDLAEALRWTRQPVTPQVERGRNFLIPAVAVAALVAAAIGGWLLTRRSDAAPARPIRFSVSPPPGMTFAQNPILQEIAVSPDGRMLALAALEGQRRKLFVRSLDALQSRPLEGTDGAAGLFWSPDSRWIGFFAAGTMKKVAVDGGPPQTIARAQGSSGSWSPDGKIIFTEWGPGTRESVRMVDERGGEVSDVTEDKRGWALWPSFLSDGRHFVFFGLLKSSPVGVYVGSIDNPRDVRLILPSHSRAEVHGDSIFYVKDAVLVRHRFDEQRNAVVGDAVPIAGPAFSFAPLGTANFSVSADGSVIAWQRTPLATQLVWRDWIGRELGRVGNPELYRHFSISPDGQRVAADIFDRVTGVSNISLFDLDRGVMTVTTSNSIGTSAPMWIHSGKALVVSFGNIEDVTEAPNLSVLTLADGSVRRLQRRDGPQYATGVTSDDREILYTIHRGRYGEIEMMSLSDGAITPLGSGGTHDESDAVISPDQRWLAFQSDESGRPEVYIRPFTGRGEKLRVSSDGGSEAQWSSHGRSLFYVRPDGMLMNAEIAAGERPRVVREAAMFAIDSAGMMELISLGVRHYQVAGDRILVREIPGHVDVDPISVMVNPPR